MNKDLILGVKTVYQEDYNAGLLLAIPRKKGRKSINVRNS